MSISTDTSISFTSSTGYRLYNSGEITFTAGTATLTSTDVKTAAVRSPQIDTSSWLYLQKIAATVTESAGFEIRFALVFGDWSGSLLKYFVVPIGGRFQVIANSDDSDSDIITAVVTKGIVAADLEKIRSWPDDVQQVSIITSFNRTVVSATGSIDQITLSYGTTELSLTDEGTASGTLSPEPDYPVPMDYAQYYDEFRFRENYVQTVELGTALRRSVNQLRWTLNDSDADTLYSFLTTHMETPFNWTATGEASSRKWVVTSTPQRQTISRGDGIVLITCSIEERL